MTPIDFDDITLFLVISYCCRN